MANTWDSSGPGSTACVTLKQSSQTFRISRYCENASLPASQDPYEQQMASGLKKGSVECEATANFKASLLRYMVLGF